MLEEMELSGMAPSRELLQAFLQKANTTRNLGDAIFFFDKVLAPPSCRAARPRPVTGGFEPLPPLQRLCSAACHAALDGPRAAHEWVRRGADAQGLPGAERRRLCRPHRHSRPGQSPGLRHACAAARLERARPALATGVCGKRSVPCGVSSQSTRTSVPHLLLLGRYWMSTLTSSQPQSVLHVNMGLAPILCLPRLDNADYPRLAQVFCLP
jgi:hypothetical protein